MSRAIYRSRHVCTEFSNSVVRTRRYRVKLKVYTEILNISKRVHTTSDAKVDGGETKPSTEIINIGFTKINYTNFGVLPIKYLLVKFVI